LKSTRKRCVYTSRLSLKTYFSILIGLNLNFSFSRMEDRKWETIWKWKEIRSTPIREGMRISLRKFDCGCKWTFLMHKQIYKFLTVKMWTRQEENQFWLPDLQKAHDTRNGRKFIRAWFVNGSEFFKYFFPVSCSL
jgi:hypothetical protein